MADMLPTENELMDSSQINNNQTPRRVYAYNEGMTPELMENYLAYLKSGGVVDSSPAVRKSIDSFATPDLPDEIEYQFNGNSVLNKIR